MKGGHPTSDRYLAYFQHLYLDFNLMNLLQGDYRLEQVRANTGGVFILNDKNGVTNYGFYKAPKSSGKEEVSFDIETVRLKDVGFVYQDDSLQQVYALEKINGTGSFSIKGKSIISKLEMNGQVDKVQIGTQNYFAQKQVKINGAYIHDQKTLNGVLKPTSLYVNGSKFKVDGKVQPRSDRYMFNVGSSKTDIQTLLSLVPNSISKAFEHYKSSGAVRFSGQVKKNSKDAFPGIDVLFDLDNVSLKEPNTNYKITNLYLNGKFNNGKKHINSTSGLYLNNIKGKLDGDSFKGDLSLVNFDDIYLKSNFSGELNLVPVARLVNRASTVKLEKGNAVFQVQLASRIKDLETGNKDKINSSGEILLSDLELSYGQTKIESLNTNLIFNDNSISVGDLTTKIGNSDFAVNGLIINPFAAVLKERKEMMIELDVKSKYIEADSLAKFFVTDEPEQQTDEEPIKYNASLNLETKKLKFNQFNLTELTGRVGYHNGVLTMHHLKFNEAKGTIELESKVDLRDKNKIATSSIGSIKGVDIQRAFELFDNFDQDFIVAENLEGNLFVDFQSKFNLTSDYEVDQNTIDLKAECTAKNGKLIDFAPMQRMSTFIKRAELANISFSDLENTIWIKDRVITIPEMDINSSISNISISGTHTLDQAIDYKVKIPLKNFAAPDKDAAFGAIEDDGSESIVHLKITGTTEDYKIAYDTKATKEKIKEGIKDEIQEFKDLIRGKIKKDSVKQTELEDDQYFEF